MVQKQASALPGTQKCFEAVAGTWLQRWQEMHGSAPPLSNTGTARLYWLASATGVLVAGFSGLTVEDGPPSLRGAAAASSTASPRGTPFLP
jgi:hypothetical protein